MRLDVLRPIDAERRPKLQLQHFIDYSISLIYRTSLNLKGQVSFRASAVWGARSRGQSLGAVSRTGRKRKSGCLDAPCPMWAACGGQALCPCSVTAVTDYRGNWLELSFQLPRTIVTNATQCLRPILRGQSPLLKNPQRRAPNSFGAWLSHSLTLTHTLSHCFFNE